MYSVSKNNPNFYIPIQKQSSKIKQRYFWFKIQLLFIKESFKIKKGSQMDLNKGFSKICFVFVFWMVSSKKLLASEYGHGMKSDPVAK